MGMKTKADPQKTLSITETLELAKEALLRSRSSTAERALKAVNESLNRMQALKNPNALLTTHDAAGIIQCDPSTIGKWIDKGILVAFRTPGGHRRIRKADMVSFLMEHEMPVPEELQNETTSAAA